VLELVGLPVLYRVAGVAQLPLELGLVRVFMAVVALLERDGLPLVLGVALGALHVLVLQCQRVGRALVVVEPGEVLPALDVVALRAVLVELLFVLVLMAAHAGLWRGHVVALFLVALGATDLGVLVNEPVLGLVVVEFLLVEGYHLEPSALMVAMALGAGVLVGGVQPLLFLYALVELVVAVEAVPVRYAAAEPVALGAVEYAIVLGVLCRKRPGAYERVYPFLAFGRSCR